MKTQRLTGDRQAVKGWLRRLHEPRNMFVARVLAVALIGALLAVFISSSGPGRLMSEVFCGLIFLVLLAFIGGLPEKAVVYVSAVLGLTYLFMVSLTEGHLYSSTLAWVPLIPLAIFYVVHPRAGTVWMVIAAGSQFLMAWVAWAWGAQLDSMNVPELPILSFVDYFLVAITLFLVPSFYQKELEAHLQIMHKRQRDLQAKQMELERMLQMREHFIASVSHELRTPMNAILGLNSLLLERVPASTPAHKVLAYTRQSADHLMTVINDVLDYSQFSSGRLLARPEALDLCQTVHAAFQMFIPQVENTALRYDCQIDSNLPQWIRADRHRLVQILVNLLGNAIKFTHQGSVTLRVSQHKDTLTFSVRDTGIGMTAQQQASVFERYRQADVTIQSQYGGNGLGLTISEQLARMMGGSMHVQSQPSQGSCFELHLPLVQAQAPVVASSQAPMPTDLAQGRWRFLVVDDHPLNRLLVRQVLQSHWPQAQIVEVDDGAKAVQACEQGPPWNAVLMDMVMPVMDGIEATRVIKSSAHETVRLTPVIGLTANVNAQDLARFEQAGLDALMLKPFEPQQLRTQVARLLRQPQPGRVH